ncbi:unnamed protein product [Protopolystoma xenopodis]|uniref:Uncharacterized protein n=1 Tax=Protopolystoma xenopodis TaxID=117903 RepID=A0A448XNZ1_9PLAT|nr:unnamed protein product [Protopolystoma xenopodis]
MGLGQFLSCLVDLISPERSTMPSESVQFFALEETLPRSNARFVDSSVVSKVAPLFNVMATDEAKEALKNHSSTVSLTGAEDPVLAALHVWRGTRDFFDDSLVPSTYMTPDTRTIYTLLQVPDAEKGE